MHRVILLSSKAGKQFIIAYNIKNQINGKGIHYYGEE